MIDDNFNLDFDHWYKIYLKLKPYIKVAAPRGNDPGTSYGCGVRVHGKFSNFFTVLWDRPDVKTEEMSFQDFLYRYKKEIPSSLHSQICE